MTAKTASIATPTSPQATAGTTSANVSPSAPLLLRSAANPGRDRSRDQRLSSPEPSAFTAPPPHMRAFTPFWDTIPADIQRQMLKFSVQEERGIEAARTEAAARATQVADAGHRRAHDKLVETKSTVTTALHGTRADLASLQQSIKECEIRVAVLEVQEQTAAAAVAASSKQHNSYTAGYRTYPYHPDATHQAAGVDPRHTPHPAATGRSH